MERATIRGVELAFDRAGSGSELVIFIHGVGADRTAWKPQLEAFANAGFTAVAIDLRGTGDSQSRAPDGLLIPIDRSEFAKDVIALVTALGFQTSYAVGNSLGGVVIQEILSMGASPFKKVVLSNTFAYHPDRAQILPRASAALRETSLSAFARIRIPQVLSSTIDPATLEEAIYAMARKDPEAYLASWRTTWSPDYRSLLHSFNVPALVVSSTLDTTTPVALANELAHGLPNARHITLKSAGHISNLDQPEEFNRAVLSFLKS